MSKKWIIISVITALFIAFLAWLFIESSKPLPGEKIADLGRGHVPAGTKVEYNSNPPTSGKHYEEWIRAGVYSEPKDDRNLVHSLEHGYVILSVKCNPSTALGTSVKSEKLEEATASGEATGSGEFKADDECRNRLEQLSRIYEKKGKRKLIVVPRENLETDFALTAWQFLDKFDQFDAGRIEKFIDAHLNQGPEKTME
ncbi:MAG: hypothetical protein G01um10147_308 [Microgenomates group bacterium Gr01-1014_7]|nr:MAG: hypothetical protein G01um10147_308 [Microgenomates group bacterium Gr01-1014_7]